MCRTSVRKRQLQSCKERIRPCVPPCWVHSFTHRGVSIGVKNVPDRVRFIRAILKSKGLSVWSCHGRPGRRCVSVGIAKAVGRVRPPCIRSYLFLLFFGTLHSDVYIFPFLLCFSLLFFSQLFVRGNPACRGTFGGRRKAVRDRFALQGGTAQTHRRRKTTWTSLCSLGEL